MRLLWLLTGWLSNSSMARMKVTPRKREDKRGQRTKTQAQVHAEAQEPPVLVDPPVPGYQEAPTQSELDRMVEETEKLGEVGRSLESSSTQQLAQMAVEARPSMLGGEEPARRKLWATVGGKAPQKEFPEGIVALCKIHPFHKSTDLIMHKLPFSCLVHEIALEVGKIWHALPGTCHFDSAGSFRGLFGWAHGRHQPLCNPYKTYNNYAQRHIISIMYPWRVSLLLKVLLPKVCFGLSVGCRLCGILLVPGKGI